MGNRPARGPYLPPPSSAAPSIGATGTSTGTTTTSSSEPSVAIAEPTRYGAPPVSLTVAVSGAKKQGELMTAVWNNDAAAVSRLLTEGENPEQLHLQTKYTCIQAAAHRGYHELIPILAAAGAKLESRSSAGHTALQVALCVSMPRENVVRALLSAKADVNAATSTFYNVPPLGYPLRPVKYAARQRLPGLIQLLLEAKGDLIPGRLHDYGDSQATVLHHVCDSNVNAMGAIPSLRVVLDHGGHQHINLADFHGVTPLMRAATDGVVGSDMIKLLLERSANIEAKDNEGRTALMYACLDTPSCVQTLLEAKANPIADSTHPRTPWMIACEQGQLKTLELLVESVPESQRRSMLTAREKKINKNGLDLSLLRTDDNKVTVVNYLIKLYTDIGYTIPVDVTGFVAAAATAAVTPRVSSTS